MKKRGWPAISLLALVVSASLVAMISKNEKAATPTRPSENEVTEHSSPRLSDISSSKREETKAAAFKKRMRAISTERRDGVAVEDGEPHYDMDADPSEYFSEERLAYMRYRKEKIGDRYHEVAGVVLEEIMNEQRHNELWTDETEVGLEKRLQLEALRGTVLDSVDCRETLCRVVVYNEDDDAYQKFFMIGTDSGPLDSPSHGRRVALPDGRIQTTVYFTSRTNATPLIELPDRVLAYVEAEDPSGNGNAGAANVPL